MQTYFTHMYASWLELIELCWNESLEVDNVDSIDKIEASHCIRNVCDESSAVYDKISIHIYFYGNTKF